MLLLFPLPRIEEIETVGTKLHDLDLGVARFADLELSIVLRQAFDVEVLKSTALLLVNSWPALGERMYLTRYGFAPSKDPELEGMWNEKKVDSTLNEALPYLQDKDDSRVVDSTLLDKLLSFDKSLKERLYPRALSISVASLNDACLIKFVIQHTFCDPSGLYRIVNAYCTLLAGGSIKPMGPRVPLQLRDEDTSAASELAAERYDGYFAHGWGALVGAAWTQWRNQKRGPKRVMKTAMVPNWVIDKLAKEAEAEGVYVTRHDLLMAWIYVATMPEIPTLAQKKSAGPPQFSFSLNIARQLKENSDFHNPWILVVSPDVEATELSTRTQIVASAQHFRSIISDVRRPEPIRQIIQKHANVRSSPIGFRDWGSIEPNITLSSWTNLPMYDLKFASRSGKVGPEFVQISIVACPLVGMLGASVADAVLTWASKDGFWLQGVLDEKLWERIVDFGGVGS